MLAQISWRESNSDSKKLSSNNLRRLVVDLEQPETGSSDLTMPRGRMLNGAGKLKVDGSYDVPSVGSPGESTEGTTSGGVVPHSSALAKRWRPIPDA